MKTDESVDVLIVEDDVILLEEMIELFELRGFAARGVDRVDEAMAALEQIPGPVLVICDFDLPGASGKDLLAILGRTTHLREKVRRFIMMTGHSDLDQEADQLIKSYPASVLRKPISIKKLIPLVEPAETTDWRTNENAGSSSS